MPDGSEDVPRHRSETFVLRLTGVDDGRRAVQWHGSLQQISTGEMILLRTLEECLRQIERFLAGLDEPSGHDSRPAG
jgi:hypothetical protein